MARCIISFPQMIWKPMFSAAHTSWMHQIWLILIGMFGLSFGRQIWREFAHTFGGSSWAERIMHWDGIMRLKAAV
jgi:hypothetical protein